jgi:hypothetical protein
MPHRRAFLLGAMATFGRLSRASAETLSDDAIHACQPATIAAIVAVGGRAVAEEPTISRPLCAGSPRATSSAKMNA